VHPCPLSRYRWCGAGQNWPTVTGRQKQRRSGGLPHLDRNGLPQRTKGAEPIDDDPQQVRQSAAALGG
jgi:hypothetical protein